MSPTYAKDGYLHHDFERRPKVKSSLACPCESKVKVGLLPAIFRYMFNSSALIDLSSRVDALALVAIERENCILKWCRASQ